MEAGASSSVKVTDAHAREHRMTQAVLTGNRSAVARLISQGNSVNRPFRGWDGNLFPLIHLASMQGHRDVVALLLAHDATIDAADDIGFTSLYKASQENRLQVVRLLLDKGAVVIDRRTVGLQH